MAACDILEKKIKAIAANTVDCTSPKLPVVQEATCYDLGKLHQFIKDG